MKNRVFLLKNLILFFVFMLTFGFGNGNVGIKVTFKEKGKKIINIENDLILSLEREKKYNLFFLKMDKNAGGSHNKRYRNSSGIKISDKCLLLVGKKTGSRNEEFWKQVSGFNWKGLNYSLISWESNGGILAGSEEIKKVLKNIQWLAEKMARSQSWENVKKNEWNCLYDGKNKAKSQRLGNWWGELIRFFTVNAVVLAADTVEVKYSKDGTTYQAGGISIDVYYGQTYDLDGCWDNTTTNTYNSSSFDFEGGNQPTGLTVQVKKSDAPDFSDPAISADIPADGGSDDPYYFTMEIKVTNDYTIGPADSFKMLLNDVDGNNLGSGTVSLTYYHRGLDLAGTIESTANLDTSTDWKDWGDEPYEDPANDHLSTVEITVPLLIGDATDVPIFLRASNNVSIADRVQIATENVTAVNGWYYKVANTQVPYIFDLDVTRIGINSTMEIPADAAAGDYIFYIKATSLNDISYCSDNVDLLIHLQRNPRNVDIYATYGATIVDQGDNPEVVSNLTIDIPVVTNQASTAIAILKVVNETNTTDSISVSWIEPADLTNASYKVYYNGAEQTSPFTIADIPPNGTSQAVTVEFTFTGDSNVGDHSYAFVFKGTSVKDNTNASDEVGVIFDVHVQNRDVDIYASHETTVVDQNDEPETNNTLTLNQTLPVGVAGSVEATVYVVNESPIADSLEVYWQKQDASNPDITVTYQGAAVTPNILIQDLNSGATSSVMTVEIDIPADLAAGTYNYLFEVTSENDVNASDTVTIALNLTRQDRNVDIAIVPSGETTYKDELDDPAVVDTLEVTLNLYNTEATTAAYVLKVTNQIDSDQETMEVSWTAPAGFTVKVFDGANWQTAAFTTIEAANSSQTMSCEVDVDSSVAAGVYDIWFKTTSQVDTSVSDTVLLQITVNRQPVDMDIYVTDNQTNAHPWTGETVYNSGTFENNINIYLTDKVVTSVVGLKNNTTLNRTFEIGWNTLPTDWTATFEIDGNYYTAPIIEVPIAANTEKLMTVEMKIPGGQADTTFDLKLVATDSVDTAASDTVWIRYNVDQSAYSDIGIYFSTDGVNWLTKEVENFGYWGERRQYYIRVVNESTENLIFDIKNAVLPTNATAEFWDEVSSSWVTSKTLNLASGATWESSFAVRIAVNTPADEKSFMAEAEKDGVVYGTGEIYFVQYYALNEDMYVDGPPVGLNVYNSGTKEDYIDSNLAGDNSTNEVIVITNHAYTTDSVKLTWEAPTGWTVSGVVVGGTAGAPAPGTVINNGSTFIVPKRTDAGFGMVHIQFTFDPPANFTPGDYVFKFRVVSNYDSTRASDEVWVKLKALRWQTDLIVSSADGNITNNGNNDYDSAPNWGGNGDVATTIVHLPTTFNSQLTLENELASGTVTIRAKLLDLSTPSNTGSAPVDFKGWNISLAGVNLITGTYEDTYNALEQKLLNFTVTVPDNATSGVYKFGVVSYYADPVNSYWGSDAIVFEFNVNQNYEIALVPYNETNPYASNNVVLETGVEIDNNDNATFEVQNLSNGPVNITINSTALNPASVKGGWTVNISETNFSLAQNETKEIDFSIDIPLDEKAGDYYLTLEVKGLDGGGNVAVQKNLPIHINVHATYDVDLKIVNGATELDEETVTMNAGLNTVKTRTKSLTNADVNYNLSVKQAPATWTVTLGATNFPLNYNGVYQSQDIDANISFDWKDTIAGQTLPVIFEVKDADAKCTDKATVTVQIGTYYNVDLVLAGNGNDIYDDTQSGNGGNGGVNFDGTVGQVEQITLDIQNESNTTETYTLKLYSTLPSSIEIEVDGTGGFDGQTFTIDPWQTQSVTIDVTNNGAAANVYNIIFGVEGNNGGKKDSVRLDVNVNQTLKVDLLADGNGDGDYANPTTGNGGNSLKNTLPSQEVSFEITYQNEGNTVDAVLVDNVDLTNMPIGTTYYFIPALQTGNLTPNINPGLEYKNTIYFVIPDNATMGTYYAILDAKSQKAPGIASDSIKLNIDVGYKGDPSAEIVVDAPNTDADNSTQVGRIEGVNSDTTYSFTLKLQNKGNWEDKFNVQITDVPAGFSAKLFYDSTDVGNSFTTGSMEINEATDNIKLHVTTPSGVIPTGVYDVVVKFVATNDLNASYEVIARLVVGNAYKVDLLCGNTPTTIDSSGANTYGSAWTGAGGAVNITILPDNTASVYFRVENESNVTASFEVTWGETGAGLFSPNWNASIRALGEVTYQPQQFKTPDIPNLGGNKDYVCDIYVPSKEIAGTVKNIYINANLPSDTSIVDSIRAVVTVGLLEKPDLIVSNEVVTNGDNLYGDGSGGGSITYSNYDVTTSTQAVLVVENEGNSDRTFDIYAYNLPDGWKVTANGVNIDESNHYTTPILSAFTGSDKIFVQITPTPTTPVGIKTVFLKAPYTTGTESVALNFDVQPLSRPDLLVGSTSTTLSGDNLFDTTDNGNGGYWEFTSNSDTWATGIVKIVNKGNINIDFKVVDFITPPGFDVKFNGSDVWTGTALGIEASLENTIEIYVPPTATPGDYYIYLKAITTTAGYPVSTDTVKIKVTVNPTVKCDLVLNGLGEGVLDPTNGSALINMNVNPLNETTAELKIINKGNSNTSFTLTSTQDPAGWADVKIGGTNNYSTPVLSPGASVVVELGIKPLVDTVANDSKVTVEVAGQDKVVAVCNDTEGPVLKTAVLNANDNILTLTFNEYYDTTAVILNDIRLQNKSGADFVTLDGATANPSNGGTDSVMVVQLTNEQAAALKNEYFTNGTVSVHILAGAVKDYNNNGTNGDVVEIEILPDTLGPKVVRAIWNKNGTYDTNDDTLTIGFDDAVDDSSIDNLYVDFTLKNFNLGANPTFNSGATNNDNTIEISIDANAILPVSGESFISITPNTIKDLFGNVASILNFATVTVDNNVVVARAIYNTSGTSEYASPLDATNDILILKFDQPVDDSSIDSDVSDFTTSDGDLWNGPTKNGTVETLDTANDNVVAIQFAQGASLVTPGSTKLIVQAGTTINNSDGVQSNITGYQVPILDGSPTYITSAYYFDDDNNGVDKNDRIVVTFNDNILNLKDGNNALTYFDIKNGFSFGVGATVVKTNNNQVTIYLGDNPSIEVWSGNATIDVTLYTTDEVNGKYYAKIYRADNGVGAKLAPTLKGVSIEVTDTNPPVLSEAYFIDKDNSGTVTQSDEVHIVFNEPVYLSGNFATLSVLLTGANDTFGSGAYIINISNVIGSKEVIIELGANPSIEVFGTYPDATGIITPNDADMYIVDKGGNKPVAGQVKDIVLKDYTAPVINSVEFYNNGNLNVFDPLHDDIQVIVNVSEPCPTNGSVLDITSFLDTAELVATGTNPALKQVEFDYTLDLGAYKNVSGTVPIEVSVSDLAGNKSATYEHLIFIKSPTINSTAEVYPRGFVANSGTGEVCLAISSIYEDRNTGIGTVEIRIDSNDAVDYTGNPIICVNKVLFDGTEYLNYATKAVGDNFLITKLGDVKAKLIKIYFTMTTTKATGTIHLNTYIYDSDGRTQEVKVGNVIDDWDSDSTDFSFIDLRVASYSVDVQPLADVARVMVQMYLTSKVVTDESTFALKAWLVPEEEGLEPLDITVYNWENIDDKGFFRGIVYVPTTKPEYWAKGKVYYVQLKNIGVVGSGTASQVSTPTFEIYQDMKYLWNAVPLPASLTPPGMERWLVLAKDLGNWGKPSIEVYIPSSRSWVPVEAQYLSGDMWFAYIQLGEGDLSYATVSVRAGGVPVALSFKAKVDNSEKQFCSAIVDGEKIIDLEDIGKVYAKGKGNVRVWQIANISNGDLDKVLSRFSSRVEEVLNTSNFYESLNKGNNVLLAPVMAVEANAVNAKLMFNLTGDHVGILTDDGNWYPIDEGLTVENTTRFFAIGKDVEKPSCLVSIRQQGRDTVLDWNVADLGSGLDKMVITVDNLLTKEIDLKVANRDYEPINLGIIPQGDYKLTVKVYDRAGNETVLEKEFRSDGASVINKFWYGPNPVYRNGGSTHFHIECGKTPQKVYIKIYTTSGRLVKVLTEYPNNATVDMYWDLKNKKYRYVRRGVYLFKLKVYFNDAVVSRVGKIAVF